MAGSIENTTISTTKAQGQIRDIADICYMSAPTTFSMQSFLRDEDSSRYASTMKLLYCIVSIVVYAVLANVLAG